MTTERTLTETEAYVAMYSWLEKYYAETRAQEVGSILGEMQLIGPAKSADGAAYSRWVKCVDGVIAKRKPN